MQRPGVLVRRDSSIHHHSSFARRHLIACLIANPPLTHSQIRHRKKDKGETVGNEGPCQWERETTQFKMRSEGGHSNWRVLACRERLIHPSAARHFALRHPHRLPDRKSAVTPPTNTPKKKRNRGNWRTLPVGDRNQPSEDAGAGDHQQWLVLVRRECFDSSIHRSSFCAPPSHHLHDRKSALTPTTIRHL